MRATADDRLLDLLGQALAVEKVRLDDDDDARAALHRALAATPAAAPGGSPGLRLIRRPVAAGVAAAIILSGGAAAAVETDALPGPIRGIAATLGLPVPPSPLAQAQNAMADLTRALAAHDIAATRAALSSLLAVLPELNASDRAQLGPAVHQLIAEAEIFLAGEPAQSSKDERAAPNSHRSSHGGGVEDSGQPTGASRDEANEHESTDGQGSGQSNTASTGSPATGGEGVSEGSEATSGSATSGGSDGDGVDGGGAVTPVPSGSPTTVGTTGSDGGSGGQTDGSDGSGATTTPTSNETSGSDGSGSSDGSTSGSDGDVVGETPR